ncbi:MAG: UDP-glucose--hexose-1-phosphate uridylyltransferase [Ruminiclostridium sp.]|nr:UDP-glucose--hexose-1-phosphate uridylyltransferase [Ruminiclostridium sp.]
MICDLIQTLIEYGMDRGLTYRDDEIYLRNRLMQTLKVDAWSEPAVIGGLTIDELLAKIEDYACENGVIEDSGAYRDIFGTELMGILTPPPHEVNRRFYMEYGKSPNAATNWYYKFSADTNYYRAGVISRDIRWKYECEYGDLDITINRSKPEKDPRDIAAARNMPKAAYPACQLCIENTGFHGTLTHPARQNLRPVPMKIEGGDWSFQYSPYGYYNEHCIVFNNEHIPMKIDAAVFRKLFGVLDILPHYFVGSNADLPIVGGSILSHEHFQGGRYTFAMEKAPAEKTFDIPAFPAVSACTVKWPMSVIRLSSTDREQLAAACDLILRCWRGYSDSAAGIFAETGGLPHNTITPIARRHGKTFECDLVLRNNITSEDRPLGIFHPNPKLHHIKKENIGLIEVMGLAVLPARLAPELELLEKALVEKADISADEKLAGHAEWLKDVIACHPEADAGNAETILKAEIGAVFEQVLLDAGVYKRDEAGQAAFERFIAKAREFV